jgi:hypothetical protein
MTRDKQTESPEETLLTKWLPWKFIASHLARQHGFMDPISVLARIKSFAQPSEVDAPVELLRAGMVMHARGLINTKVIQQNLDWLWPYWVQRQFDPNDRSFLPRAFTITHINLTHRNWTGVGIPGCQAIPIVDPRGMVTPFFDGWSIDAWIIPEQGEPLLPSREGDDSVTQKIETASGLAVDTRIAVRDLDLWSHVHAEADGKDVRCCIDYAASTQSPAWLVIAVRPFNPEGVSFINHIEHTSAATLDVDKAASISFSQAPDKVVMSRYRHGDVYATLPDGDPVSSVSCDVGLCTAAAMFRLNGTRKREVQLSVDLGDDEKSKPLLPRGSTQSWNDTMRRACDFAAPDERFVELYDNAVRTLVLLCPEEPYPGAYTYKRFWFRDAAFLLYAMLSVGLKERVGHAISQFNERQTLAGFYHSQEGEWDSNGQVLWLLGRYTELTGQSLQGHWAKAIRKAVHWIRRKRLSGDGGELHDGLMPAGFSAEHLGNNDYYYWDDYWSVAGLDAAENLMAVLGDDAEARACRDEAASFRAAIAASLDRSRHIRDTNAIPASPHRRMDAGAIGSLAAGYPLQLLSPDDPELLATVDWLHENCMFNGAFFQEMIHSGLNAYLTLHMAQIYLRAGRDEYWPLVQAVADMASSTGQWPEAVHPQTGGGCMGDGQHGWAAAEWVLMMRSLFVREEQTRLILGAGIPQAWLNAGERIAFGPTPTRFGDVTVVVDPSADGITVTWEGPWRQPPEVVGVRVGGYEPQDVFASDVRRVTLAPCSDESRGTLS